MLSGWRHARRRLLAGVSVLLAAQGIREILTEPGMASPEVGAHGSSREQVSDCNAVPRQLPKERVGQQRYKDVKRQLEGDEENEGARKHRRLSMGRVDHDCR